MAGPEQSAEIDTLTLIWQRAFDRAPIGIHEDFFDLGGDRLRAVRIFGEIAEKFNKTLSPTTICWAPTIAALAPMIATLQPSSPLVLLKEGREEPPLFLTHGIGSSVIDLVRFARQIETRRAIYGMEARGNFDTEEPMDRVEDMAQFFVDSVRKVQAEGPYFLIGYSLGGLVTLEMARQLSQEGGKIALLAMLDSYPDRRVLPIGQHLRLIMQLATRRLKDRKSLTKRPDRTMLDGSFAVAMQTVRRAQYRALHNYRPRFYDGNVMFVRAAVPSYFPSDPIPVWSPLIKDLIVEPVPGNHIELLTLNVGALASVVTRYLESLRLET